MLGGAVGGLSPLARGTQAATIDDLIHQRFIPAGAGNSKLAFASACLRSVYPRWRGELARSSQRDSLAPGLSPLARGTLVSPGGETVVNRFIPAGAGNSTIANLGWWLSTVYPRWRGELGVTLAILAISAGLSPLARGTPSQRSGRQEQPRFIPAGAGNSCALRPHIPPIPVYPRWRGELSPALLFGVPPTGLSPLARGTRTFQHQNLCAGRFIPAGAGNSVKKRLTKICQPVYPRWRGELGSTSRGPAGRCGLSPLARGTQVVIPGQHFLIRFIPAGAGNSRAFFSAW